MIRFYLRIVVYLLSFILCMYAMNAFDFNRFIKKGIIKEGQLLFIIIAIIMAYLFGNFVMDCIYYFN